MTAEIINLHSIVVEQTKVCSKCKLAKNLSDFYAEKTGKYGKRGQCKICNKGRHKKASLKRYYGMPIEQYNALFEKQQGKCYICDQHQSELSKSLAVDHCHTTLKIRGLLCNNCNTALGLLKENISTIKNMIKYLEDYT